MKKISFAMPIYPPHFRNALNFITSFKKHKLHLQSDFYLVFSNSNDQEKFRALAGKADFKSLILPFIPQRTNATAAIKKFYALSCLKKLYQYIIVVDSESLIIKNIDLMKMCDEFYQNKILYGNETLAGIKLDRITNRALWHFKNHPQLKNAKTNLYLWFNQICIYENECLEEFFKLTRINENLTEVLWEDFEHYIYMTYLILYRNFRIENIEIISRYGIFEAYNFKPTSMKFLYTQFYHCTPGIYNLIDTRKVFMFIQIDRKGILPLNSPDYIFKNACSRVKETLSYQLGFAMIKNFKGFKIFKLPFILAKIAIKYKKIQQKYQFLSLVNPILQLPSLESYVDFPKALECKKHLSYILGSTLIKSYKRYKWGGGISFFV